MKKKKTEEEIINEENLNEIEDTNNKSKNKKLEVEEPLDIENLEDTDEEQKILEEAIKEIEEELLEKSEVDEESEDNIQMNLEKDLSNEVQENIDSSEDVSIKENEENKKTESIFSKRVEIPLVGLILVVLIIITAIISLIIFKDRIFNFNTSNDQSNQTVIDNKLNDNEQIGYNLISKWLENYKNSSLDITSKILSYNITSISLNNKEEDKFIILATFDVVPATMDSSLWLENNGEREGETVKNKSQYFVIEKISNNYEITNTSTEKPDIASDVITEEKVMISIKNEFPDPESLKLAIDSSMIDGLIEEKKTEIINKIGLLENYYKITGSYRETYILGTILVNKNTQEKWFVDVEGEVFSLEKATQILNIADFEVQGDLSMTLDQAILVTFNSFPKNKRQALSLVENWLDSIENKETVQSTLGNLNEYYALKTSTSKGFILVNKNGLSKEFVSLDGTITDLVGIEDITSIIL